MFLAVALLMVFTASEVMAQTTFPPESCTFGLTGYTITTVAPFPLMINSTTDPKDPAGIPYFNTYPCWASTGVTCAFPYFVYAYSISPSSNISQISQLLPVCRESIGLLASVPAMYTTKDPGVPENYGSKTWPVGIYDGQVMTWSSSPSSGKLYIATKTAAVDINSMVLKSGNNFNYCTGGIAGPGCPCGIAPASILPGNVIEYKKYGPIQVKVERDYITFCIKTMWHCKNSDCTQLEEVLPLPPDDFQVSDSQGNQFFVQCGESSGNQRCPECFIFSEASPGCVYIPSGGTVRKVCSP